MSRRKRKTRGKQHMYQNQFDDPNAPIIIYNNPPNNSDNDRILLYRIYEEEELKIQNNIKRLHAAWDIIYDVFKQKKEIEKQLENVNKLIEMYKQKFGELPDENDEPKIENNIKEEHIENNNSKSSGAWFGASALLISLAILGGCYYLKR